MLTKSPTMFSSIIQWATEERPLELPRRIRIAIPILILGLALGLRIHLAGIAYPAQLDSTHMIQQGILWVQGEPGALSTIWQEFPVLTAGIAYRLGYNPAEALQWSTVIFGTILVGMTMLLTRRLFDSNAAAWIAGMWATTNPALLNYSVNSMPEIGFAACLVSAYAVLASAIGGQSLKPVPILTGYALLALGIYFKPLDSLAAFALISLAPGTGGDLLWPVLGICFSLSNIAYSLVAQAFPASLSGRANTALNLLVFAGAFGLQWGIGGFVDILQAGGWATEAAFRSAFMVLLGGQALALVWLLLPARRR